MCIDLDDAISRSFVLTDQPWQYGLFCKRMQAAGFKTMPREYSTRYPQSVLPELSRAHVMRIVSLTHYHLVSMAQSLGWESILVFEWDAYPMTDCYRRLGSFLRENPVPDSACVVGLGNTSWVTAGSGRGKYVPNSDMYGAHAVLYRSVGYANWLSGYRAIHPHDRCYVDQHGKICDCVYSTNPSFFLQVHDRPQMALSGNGVFRDFSGLDPDTGSTPDYYTHKRS